MFNNIVIPVISDSVPTQLAGSLGCALLSCTFSRYDCWVMNSDDYASCRTVHSPNFVLSQYKKRPMYWFMRVIHCNIFDCVGHNRNDCTGQSGHRSGYYGHMGH